MNINKILVVVEPDRDEQPAVERAARLARLANAELELFLAEFNPYLADGFYFDPVQAQDLRYQYGEQRMQELEALAVPLREQGIEVSVTTAWGHPAYAEILRRVEESNPALVVKAARHHSRVARLLLDHADWELVRQCPVPLLLAKGEAWQDEPVIVASVDPNHVNDKPALLDDSIIRTAKQLADLSQGTVKLFHSAWIPPLSGLYPLQPDVAREEDQLLKLGSKHGIPEANCEWSLAPIEESLSDLITAEGVSLVVMGAVSRSRLDQALVGNTAEKLLDELTCDILVVRPESS